MFILVAFSAYRWRIAFVVGTMKLFIQLPRSSFRGLAILVFLAAGLPGCMSRDAADADKARIVEPTSLPLPKRDLDEADRLAEALPARVSTYGPIDSAVSEWPGREGNTLLLADKVSVGGSVLLHVDKVATSQAFDARPTPSGAFFRKVLTPVDGWRAKFDPPPSFEIEGVTYYTQNPLAEWIRDSKEYIALPSPRNEPLGTVIWFGGIGPSWKLEMAAQVDVVKQGFALVAAAESVLTQFARLRVRLMPIPTDPNEYIKLRLAAFGEAVSKQYSRVALFENAKIAGESLARELNQSVIDSASGAEPVLQWLELRQPSLQDRPLIVIGCSGGVPAALAFASRNPDRLAGLAIIGGFEDFETLLRTTDLNDGEPTIHWRDDTPLPEQEREFSQSFASTCKVDPGDFARTISTDRVLMIQGRFDTLVWESLGRPERWKFFGGHRLLFWRLSSYGNEIAA